MKNLKFLLLLIPFGMFAMPLFAQDAVLDPDLQSYFLSLAAMIPLVTFVMGLVKKLLNLKKVWAQIVSWLVSIGLCYLGWILKLGMFADVVQWFIPLAWGFGIGLAANGFFKIELVKALLRVLGLEPKAKDVNR